MTFEDYKAAVLAADAECRTAAEDYVQACAEQQRAYQRAMAAKERAQKAALEQARLSGDLLKQVRDSLGLTGAPDFYTMEQRASEAMRAVKQEVAP